MSMIELNIQQAGNDTLKVWVPSDIDVLALKIEVERELSVPCAEQQFLFRGRLLADTDRLVSNGIKHGSKLKLDTAAQAPVDLAESITSFVECFAGETVGAIVGDIVGANPKPSAECVKVESDRNRSTLAQIAEASKCVDDMLVMIEELDSRVQSERAANFQKEILSLQELLETHLCLMDEFSGNEEIRRKRKIEVRRLNMMCDHLDMMKQC
mmetsp:Transcript_6795/g.12923  ORF Transcript_6795/g.12923 Transcript_6795/m.12923 type:complete len:212 (+) Transcript_6795:120-755(+)|eukprot:CAMPEP_0114253012 /NCGR_PEP_ID=MMETSP0058-20121206/16158_1 /TAXON_ID=36894 /ORGANISM="Pyramimonas parkeae, CCMP726" /LENGTH=211 /DNA_ID=CAMNT_0001367015 /DNA_START=60 /DNA_END=695 /DNA_ORIENTATION=+